MQYSHGSMIDLIGADYPTSPCVSLSICQFSPCSLLSRRFLPLQIRMTIQMTLEIVSNLFVLQRAHFMNVLHTSSHLSFMDPDGCWTVAPSQIVTMTGHHVKMTNQIGGRKNSVEVVASEILCLVNSLNYFDLTIIATKIKIKLKLIIELFDVQNLSNIEQWNVYVSQKPIRCYSSSLLTINE